LALGVAQANVWGIESDSDESSFRALEEEQIAEAEAIARETAAQITAIPFLSDRAGKKRGGRATGHQRT
jgi:hypothetical protein